MLKRADKEAIISSIKSDFDKSQAVFLTNLIGLTSNDAVNLRKKVRLAGGKVLVTRNSFFEKASAGTTYEKTFSKLKGPHALAFAFTDAAAVAKCLKEANSENELVSLKGGVLDGKNLSAQELKQLADLPSRDQMLGTLLATFIAPVSALARVLHAIKEQKESAAAPSAV